MSLSIPYVACEWLFSWLSRARAAHARTKARLALRRGNRLNKKGNHRAHRMRSLGCRHKRTARWLATRSPQVGHKSQTTTFSLRAACSERCFTGWCPRSRKMRGRNLTQYANKHAGIARSQSESPFRAGGKSLDSPTNRTRIVRRGTCGAFSTDQPVALFADLPNIISA